jgi:2-polyprenyl-3-methyl-5-hydroxy-6-metoxy-1,4-benzoquinol methylase
VIGNGQCALCSAPLQIEFRNYPGYREPSHYDILHCEKCNTSVASPCNVDEDLYDAIYARAPSIVGYSRYARFADEVLGRADALAYLAGEEDTYWGVKRLIENGIANVSGQIIEVGSGFGYLTYALSKSGLNIFGLELSETAVLSATNLYGNLYRHGSVTEWVAEPDSLSCVIMTEVIEHVERPLDLIASCLRLLCKGGTLLLTTPNKSFHNRRAVWATEAPPVHLWWFSEESLRAVARHHNAKIHFVDFSDFNRTHGIPPRPTELVMTGPILGSDDEPLHPVQRLQSPGGNSLVGVLKPLLRPGVRSFRARRARANGTLHQRPTLCVALEKS